MDDLVSFFFFFATEIKSTKLSQSFGKLRNATAEAAYIHVSANIKKDFGDMSGTHLPP